jgi:hypothetical protein
MPELAWLTSSPRASDRGGIGWGRLMYRGPPPSTHRQGSVSLQPHPTRPPPPEIFSSNVWANHTRPWHASPKAHDFHLAPLHIHPDIPIAPPPTMSQPSLASFVIKRPWLKRWMTPLATWYSDAAGYRKLGLRYVCNFCNHQLGLIGHSIGRESACADFMKGRRSDSRGVRDRTPRAQAVAAEGGLRSCLPYATCFPGPPPHFTPRHSDI